MKFAVVICIILLVFVGFQFYDVIQTEIDEAKVSQLNEVDINKSSQLSVDNLIENLGYTHRKTTYEQPSSDIIKAASSLQLNASYASIVYYESDDLVHEEYAVKEYNEIDLGHIKGSCIFVLKIEDNFKSNFDQDEYTIYDLGDDFKLFYVQPKQTGIYHFITDDLTIKYELLQK